MEVYQIGDVDCVVARDKKDAWELWEEETGMTPDEVDGVIQLVPGDKVWTIEDEETGEKTQMTCAEWAEKNGRGLLCSSEY
jgi:hypothetical protein